MYKLIACLLSALLMLPAGGSAQSRQLEVVFLDAGKSDAIIILTDSGTVLIDAGKNSMGKEIVAFLKSRQVERVDVMIISHFDKDHVGGADKVLEAMPVDLVIEPAYQKESKQRDDYMQALEQTRTSVESLSGNASFELDGASFSIDVANESDYGPDEENDFSLVTSLRFGQVSFLFAGDAENARLAELLKEGGLSHHVLKVPHHGKGEKLSAAFFQAVGPSYAVITSDEKNPEDEVVPALLRQLGAEVFLTREGAVTALTDGESIRVMQPQKTEQSGIQNIE